MHNLSCLSLHMEYIHIYATIHLPGYTRSCIHIGGSIYRRVRRLPDLIVTLTPINRAGDLPPIPDLIIRQICLRFLKHLQLTMPKQIRHFLIFILYLQPLLSSTFTYQYIPTTQRVNLNSQRTPDVGKSVPLQTCFALMSIDLSLITTGSPSI